MFKMFFFENIQTYHSKFVEVVSKNLFLDQFDFSDKVFSAKILQLTNIFLV